MQSPPPARAPVRPRVRARHEPSGEPRLLEEELAALLERGATGTVVVSGRSGSGVGTALRHIAHLFEGDPRLRVDDLESLAADDRGAAYSPTTLSGRWDAPLRVIGLHAEATVSADEYCARFVLVPWTDDDLIEYLLHAHAERCAAVLVRLGPSRWHRRFHGRPFLWASVLDVLARDDDVPDLPAALRAVLAEQLPPVRLHLARACAYERVVSNPRAARPLATLDEDFRRWLGSDAATALCVLDETLERMRLGQPIHATHIPHIRYLLDDLAAAVAADPVRVEALKDALLDDEALPANLAASLLHRIDPAGLVGWIEGACRLKLSQPRFDRASLARADWTDARLRALRAVGVDLRRATLAGAMLGSADLRGARLARADLTGADLHSALLLKADLRGADLTRADLRSTDLTRARLSDARLTGARLSACDLRRALLSRADLAEADLSRARLDDLDLRDVRIDDACLVAASLVGVRLEHVSATGVDLTRAVLRGADMTASRLRDARLVEADLGQAGLAEIDWEGVDLRGTDLTHASFHLGSSRSGIVPGGYPSQGTRTGFYTDDGRGLTHRPPEEVRKANLRGTRMVGARVLDTDFYLVDLRDAEYDPEQEAHFRACGAILST